MRYSLLAAVTAAALLALPSAAAAQSQDAGWFMTRTCIAGGALCTWQGGTPSNTGIAKIITVPRPTNPDDLAELEAREAEWERICEPIIVPDRDGIRRYTYGPACPNGVIVGTGKRPRQ